MGKWALVGQSRLGLCCGSHYPWIVRAVIPGTKSRALRGRVLEAYSAARTVVTAVLLGLIKTVPKAWRLAGVLLATSDRQRLMSLLPQTPEGAAPAGSLIGGDRHFPGILATITKRMDTIETVAKSWQDLAGKVSLKRWLQGESVLLIREDHDLHGRASPIIQAILACAPEFVLTQKHSNDRRSWICLDDLCRAGRLDTLPKLMIESSHQSGCIALSASGAKEIRQFYGAGTTEEMLAACSHRIALRTSDPEDAAWAERHFSSPLRASNLLSLPPPGPESGFSVLQQTPRAGTHRTYKSRWWILANLYPGKAAQPTPRLQSEHAVELHADPAARRFTLRRVDSAILKRPARPPRAPPLWQRAR